METFSMLQSNMIDAINFKWTQSIPCQQNEAHNIDTALLLFSCLFIYFAWPWLQSAMHLQKGWELQEKFI